MTVGKKKKAPLYIGLKYATLRSGGASLPLSKVYLSFKKVGGYPAAQTTSNVVTLEPILLNIYSQKFPLFYGYILLVYPNFSSYPFTHISRVIPASNATKKVFH